MSRSGNILLTGGFGFIGAALSRRLVGDGHDVAFLELGSGDLGRLGDARGKVTVKEVDLRDHAAVQNAVKEVAPDIIIHLAAYYAVEHRPDEVPAMVGTNVQGLANLLEAARATGPRLFINTSSCFVYEQTGRPLGEDGPVKPSNLYAMTKRFGEELCSFYSSENGLGISTFRIFSPYGPGDHDRRLIPSVIKSCLQGEAPRVSSGRQIWDFVYIDDIVDAYVRALEYSPRGHEILNIGSGKSVPVRDIVMRIRKLMGPGPEPLWGAIPHRKNEIWSMTADISRARQLLQWEPQTEILGKGLERTVRWFADKYGGTAR
jgi:nucleoside-diphosphate-sugar epimerase